MGSYERFELQGPERERALAAIREQIAAWGLVMPAVAPLVLDFGLGRFPEIGETEFWVANETDRGYCGKFLFLFDDQTCPHHHHRMKHETFFIVKGAIRMKVGAADRILQEGDVLVMPAGAGHSFTGIGPALVLEVSMPSMTGDNLFGHERIGDNGVM